MAIDSLPTYDPGKVERPQERIVSESMESALHNILMCRPDFFQIDYVINPWMTGNLHRSRPAEAAQQWAGLRAMLIEQADILEVEPVPVCPDMVFTANAGLLLGKIAVPSRFLHAERRPEEPHFTAWFEAHGFEIHQLPADLPFEGAGDALLDRENPWLWAGYGMRTELQAHSYLERILGLEVLSLRLVNPRFYHLDTCFCPLEGGVLLYYPPAFDAASLRLIESRVPAAKRIALAETDALNFTCNAVNLGQTVIVNRASENFKKRLGEAGFTVRETPLDEFMKAGGAAKCLTLRLDEIASPSATAQDTTARTGLENRTSVRCRVLSLEGHLLDSGTLSRALDTVIDGGGSFQILNFALGQQRHSPSEARIRVCAPSSDTLQALVAQLVNLGAHLDTAGENVSSAAEPTINRPEVRLEPVVQAGVAPEGFYATGIYPTDLFLNGRWIVAGQQRMDAVIAVDTANSSEPLVTCKLIRDLKIGEQIAVGIEGIRTRRPETPRAPGGKDSPADEFAFMGAGISSERHVELEVEKIAWELHRLREQGGKTVAVAGPVVIHTGGGPHLARLIREGYIGALLAGNALAVHDIESALFGTSLGVDLQRGSAVPGGHRHHLRAINQIRRCGGIGPAVEQGLLTRGIFYECVRAGVPYSLAGSIRDDGPLPDTEMNLIKAQADYARLLQGSRMTLMLSTMLHSIGAGNMTPAGVKLVCVDINPAVVTKLADRGSLESVGIVTDVGLFLSLLVRRLEKLEGGGASEERE